MDATRADLEFTAEVIAIALEEGATTINVPDTVGYSMPDEYAEMFAELRRLVPGLADVTTSVHCHDDLGLAVANSFAGRRGRLPPGGVRDQRPRRAGGQRLAGGDRDAAARARGRARAVDRGAHRGDRAHQPARVAPDRLPVQPNKAIVGRNAFAHESGIHQDGVLKERTTYEIMEATTIGLEQNSIVLGKHSGRHALRKALEELGFEVDGAALNTAFKRFKEVADRKKTVTALDLEAIVSDEMRQSASAYELESFEIEAGSERVAVRPRHGAPARRRDRVGELHRRRSRGGPLQRAQRRHRPGGAPEGVPRVGRHGRARRPRRGHRAGGARRRQRAGPGRLAGHHGGLRPGVPAGDRQRALDHSALHLAAGEPDRGSGRRRRLPRPPTPRSPRHR